MPSNTPENLPELKMTKEQAENIPDEMVERCLRILACDDGGLGSPRQSYVNALRTRIECDRSQLSARDAEIAGLTKERDGYKVLMEWWTNKAAGMEAVVEASADWMDGGQSNKIAKAYQDHLAATGGTPAPATTGKGSCSTALADYERRNPEKPQTYDDALDKLGESIERHPIVPGPRSEP
jgi:hypothetical protein